MSTHRQRPAPLSTPALGTLCEQAVLTSAFEVLSVSQGGFGPVGLSAGWPWPTDKSAGLRDAVRYTQRADAPASLSVRRIGDGATYVLFKVLAGTDLQGRPGRHLVHALRATELHPAAALLAPPRTTFITEWPVDRASTRDLPQVSLPAPVFTADMARFARHDLVAAALRYCDGSGTAIELIAARPDQAAEALLGMFAVLPLELTNRLTFSTYEPAESEVDISTRIQNLSKPSRRERQVIELAAAVPTPTTPPDAFDELAVLVMSTPPANLPAAKTIAELRQLLVSARLLAADPRQLSDGDIAVLLDGPDAEQWIATHSDAALERALQVARQPGSGRLADLLTRVIPPAARASLAVRLQSAGVDAVIAGGDAATDFELAEVFAGHRLEFAEDLAARAVDALRRGKLTAAAAARVAETASRPLAALDREQKMAWLTIDDTPVRGEFASAWVGADVAAALLGSESGPTDRLERWLAYDPERVSEELAALLNESDRQVSEQRQTAVSANLARMPISLRANAIHAVLRASIRATQWNPVSLIAPMFARSSATDEDVDSFGSLIPDLAELCGIPRNVAQLFIERHVGRRGWFERILRRT